MARAPFIGRLYWYSGRPRFSSHNHRSLTLPPCRREYIALFASLIFVFLEGFIRIITLGLRQYFFPGINTTNADPS